MSPPSDIDSDAPRPARCRESGSEPKPGRPAVSRGEPRYRLSVTGVIHRLVPLVVAAVVLYGVAPAILEVLGAYQRLRDVDPGWWIVMVATSAAGIWCMCSLQRLALNSAPWFPVATSQLAGATFSKVVPGGSAAAAALQARMLAQAGLAPAAIGTGLTAGALLLLSALAGLPLLALPALLFGRHIPDGLLQTAGIGLAIFLALFVVGTLLLLNDRLLTAVARTLQGAERRLRRWRTASDALPERLFNERNLLRRSLGRDWPRAVATAAGRWIFDFVCLYAACSPSVPGRRCTSRSWRIAPPNCSGRSRSRRGALVWSKRAAPGRWRSPGFPPRQRRWRRSHTGWLRTGCRSPSGLGLGSGTASDTASEHDLQRGSPAYAEAHAASGSLAQGAALVRRTRTTNRTSCWSFSAGTSSSSRTLS